MEELRAVCSRGMARVSAAYGNGFKQSVLSKFPLSLADNHVITVAIEHGWQDQWMIPEKPKRGRRVAAEAAAAQASRDVGSMLATQVGSGQQAAPNQPPQVTAPQVPEVPQADDVADRQPLRRCEAQGGQGQGPAAVSAEASSAERVSMPAFEPRTPVRSENHGPAEMPGTVPSTPAPGAFSKSAPPVRPVQGNTGPQCVFCWEMLSSGPVTALPCAHAFHTSCLGEWRQVQGISNMSKCPLNCHRSMPMGDPGSLPEMFRPRAREARTDNDDWEIVDGAGEDDGANSDGNESSNVQGPAGDDTPPGGDDDSDADVLIN